MGDPFARPDYSAAPWPLFLNARDWAIVLRDVPAAVETTDGDGTVRRSVAGRTVVLYPTAPPMTNPVREWRQRERV